MIPCGTFAKLQVLGTCPGPVFLKVPLILTSNVVMKNLDLGARLQVLKEYLHQRFVGFCLFEV